MTIIRVKRGTRPPVAGVTTTKVMTDGMTVADAIALLTDRAGLTRDAAEAELRWILAHPTDGSAAALGRREILTLRAAVAPADDVAALDRFHRALLEFGALPPGLAGWGMGLAR